MGRRAAARRRGFTLLELINGVSLTLVLASLGMYALARYLRNAKTAEAVNTVHDIAGRAAAYYDTSDAHPPPGFTPDSARVLRRFPPSSDGSVPADTATVRAKRYQSAPGDWAGPTWRAMDFSMQEPQSYAYSFESRGIGPSASATVTAQGDLDGDGVSSTYRLSVAPDDLLHAVVSPTLDIQNPSE